MPGAAALEGSGARLALVGSPYAVPPGRVRAGSGLPYRVFTRTAGPGAVGWPAPQDRPTGPLAGGRLHHLGRDVGAEPDAASLPSAGESAAQAALDSFLRGPVRRYGTPGTARPRGTSRLSPTCASDRSIPARCWPACRWHRIGGVPFRAGVARVLRRRALAPPGLGLEPLLPSAATCGGTPGPGPTSGSTPGPPVAPASHWSTRACASCRPRDGCTTGSHAHGVLPGQGLHLDWRRGAGSSSTGCRRGPGLQQPRLAVGGRTGTDAAPFHRCSTGPAGRALRSRGGLRPAVRARGGRFGYPAPIVDHAAERAEALRRWDEAKLALAAGGSP